MEQKIRVNEGWEARFGNGEWDRVTLPHTPRLEAADCDRPWQGDIEYRRVFDVPKEWADKRVALELEGAMIHAALFVNGSHVCDHAGGYLPLVADIGALLRPGEKNELTVSLDNRDDPKTPPGKPTSGLDFLYYGGLYRNAWLYVTPKVYITNAVQANKVNGGGLLITTQHVSPAHAVVAVKANIRNDLKKPGGGTVQFSILDASGACVSKASVRFSAGAQRDCDVKAEMEIVKPGLWDLDSPTLYTCVCTAQAEGLEAHTVREQFGIRTLSMSKDGLLLNNKLVRLFGVNRHQQVPYLGIASSDEAEAREARRLKAMRINTLRLSHYPQSPAFLSACDELGILLIEPVPGWQFSRGGIFYKRLTQNLRDMIRRDRNHPSIAFFEISPNETGAFQRGASDKNFRKLHLAAKEELPGCLTAGDVAGRRDAEKIGYDLPYTGEDSKAKKREPYAGKPLLTREYGDWAFGGNNSTSRVSRGDGEAAQLRQAWNFQWTHNDNFNKKKLAGDLIWEGIDHTRGYFREAPISRSGVLDLFRLPKFSYYFVRSQHAPKGEDDIALFPAAWSPLGKEKLVVYANCGEVALFDGETELARRRCDDGPDAPFDENAHEKIKDDYWMTQDDHIATSKKISHLAKHTMRCQFDGGNCRNVAFPPFTFTGLPTHCPSLTVVGYLDGKEAKRTVLRAPGEPRRLSIYADTQGIPLRRDGNDFLYVYVSVTDEAGMVVPSAQAQVKLSVSGGKAVYTDTMEAEAGVAPFLVRGAARKMIITACAGGLEAAMLELD